MTSSYYEHGPLHRICCRLDVHVCGVCVWNKCLTDFRFYPSCYPIAPHLAILLWHRNPNAGTSLADRVCVVQTVHIFGWQLAVFSHLRVCVCGLPLEKASIQWIFSFWLMTANTSAQRNCVPTTFNSTHLASKFALAPVFAGHYYGACYTTHR